MRDRIDPLADYATALSGPIPDYLLRLERQTYLKTIAPQMMCGPVQGRLLALLSRLVRPTRVLEIGTFTGYATLCLAEGLAPNGRIETIEGDPEIAARAARNFAGSPFGDRIDLLRGDAYDLLPTLPGLYDLIFLDGDKRGYPRYLPVLVERLRPGGLLIADNVLWDGKAGRNTTDPTAANLQTYNQLAAAHPQLSALILPIRDGLSICRKN
ncbi:O-methyltransferase [Lewinella sp. IMCC34183]|uniref:O-methyltransferase n=1 Tax=Lewinella sp. IMCC34183 TaxID=2248762 RepID=UPI000E27A345|nr:O-methyltransferase [Lewinella sp. IMCC34183]